MARKVFSTTMDEGLLKQLKILAVQLDRPLNHLLEEAARKLLQEKQAADPDALLFAERAAEPEVDCVRAIKARIVKIERKRAEDPVPGIGQEGDCAPVS